MFLDCTNETVLNKGMNGLLLCLIERGTIILIVIAVIKSKVIPLIIFVCFFSFNCCFLHFFFLLIFLIFLLFK